MRRQERPCRQIETHVWKPASSATSLCFVFCRRIFLIVVWLSYPRVTPMTTTKLCFKMSGQHALRRNVDVVPSGARVASHCDASFCVDCDSGQLLQLRWMMVSSQSLTSRDRLLQH